METVLRFSLDDYKTEAILQLLPSLFEISDITIHEVTIEQVVASIFAANHSQIRSKTSTAQAQHPAASSKALDEPNGSNTVESAAEPVEAEDSTPPHRTEV